MLLSAFSWLFNVTCDVPSLSTEKGVLHLQPSMEIWDRKYILHKSSQKSSTQFFYSSWREEFYCIPWLTQVPCLIATIQLLEGHWHQAIQHRQYYIVVYKAIGQSGSHRVHEVEHSPPRGYCTKEQVKYIWNFLKTSEEGWNPIRDNNMRCLFTYYTALFLHKSQNGFIIKPHMNTHLSHALAV